MQDDFIGAGWAFPMRTTPSGGIALVKRERELEEAIRIVLSTYPGERPMRPEFGCRLRDYVFANITGETLASLTAEVHKAVTRWEPRVDVQDVQVIPSPQDPSLVYIDIFYVPKDTNDRRNLVFPFYTIPDDGSDY